MSSREQEMAAEQTSTATLAVGVKGFYVFDLDVVGCITSAPLRRGTTEQVHSLAAQSFPV